MKKISHIFTEMTRNHPYIWGGAVAVGCVVVATALRALIDPIVYGVPFITFFPAVALAAYLGGSGAGIATMLLGGLIAAYFWVPPFYSLALPRDRWITVGIYVFLSGLLVFLVHRLRSAAARAAAAEKTSQLYAREMAHRMANLVTLVQAVASMTFRGDGSRDEQQKIFDARLVALGRALTGPMNSDGNQDILSMIQSVLLPFGDRIQISGQSVGVTPEAAAKLALIFHELGTNAIKYGALSVGEGRVYVASSATGESLIINWEEKGGPPVNPTPRRRGFGSRLLTSSLSQGAGSVEVNFDPAGLTARVTLNKNQLII